jgi:hypothetical protein
MEDTYSNRANRDIIPHGFDATYSGSLKRSKTNEARCGIRPTAVPWERSWWSGCAPAPAISQHWRLTVVQRKMSVSIGTDKTGLKADLTERRTGWVTSVRGRAGASPVNTGIALRTTSATSQLRSQNNIDVWAEAGAPPPRSGRPVVDASLALHVAGWAGNLSERGRRTSGARFSGR